MAGVAAGAVVGLGAAMLKIGSDFDAAYDTIQTSTGATGKALEGLKEDFKAAVADIPADFGTVSGVIGSLNTALGLTGPPLQSLTKQVAEASRVLKEDGAANADLFGKAINQWQAPVESAGTRLDELFKITQDYGLGLNELIGQLNAYGPVLQNANFSMREAADLFGRMNKGGIEVSRVMPGLNAAFRRWADQGKEAREEFDRVIKTLQTTEDDMLALKLATEAFGAEGAQRLLTGIRNGALPALDDLGKELDNVQGLVEETGKKNRTLGERWQVIWNDIQVAVEPVAGELVRMAEALLDDIAPAISEVSKRLGGLIDIFTTTRDVQQTFADWQTGIGEIAEETQASADKLRSMGREMANTRHFMGDLITGNFELRQAYRDSGLSLTDFRLSLFRAANQLDKAAARQRENRETAEAMRQELLRGETVLDDYAGAVDLAKEALAEQADGISHWSRVQQARKIRLDEMTKDYLPAAQQSEQDYRLSLFSTIGVIDATVEAEERLAFARREAHLPKWHQALSEGRERLDDVTSSIKYVSAGLDTMTVSGGRAATAVKEISDSAETLAQRDFASRFGAEWGQAYRAAQQAQRDLTEARRGDIIAAHRVNDATRELRDLQREISEATRPFTDRERHLRVQLREMDIADTQTKLSKARGREALEVELSLRRLQAEQIRDRRSGDLEHARQNLVNHEKALTDELKRREAVLESRDRELQRVETRIAIENLGDKSRLDALQTAIGLEQQLLDLAARTAGAKGADAGAAERVVEQITAAQELARRTGAVAVGAGFAGEPAAQEADRLRRALKTAGRRTGGEINALRNRVLESGIVAPRLAAGGIVQRPTLALIGEAGPEAVVPLTGGRGLAPAIQVNIRGTVVTERQLEDVIVRAYHRAARQGRI